MLRSWIQPTFVTAPADRSILTVSAANTLTSSKPALWFVDGAQVAAGANTTWTPGATNFNQTLQAANSKALTVSVAEANRCDIVLSNWTRTSINAPSSGETDPFGGTGAYKFTFPAATASHNISKAMSPISTVANSGFEIWAEYNASMPCIMIFPINDDSSEYCGINLLTGDKVGNFADECIVQTVGNWKRVQFRRGKGTFTTSTVNIYFKKALSDPLTTTETTDGSEFIRLYFPRSADGVLPFTNFDQFQRFSIGTRSISTTGSNPYAFTTSSSFESRSPFIDQRLDMNQNRGYIDVVLPDTYNANRTTPYKVLFVLEVENTPGTSFVDGLGYLKSIGAHNTYDVVMVRTTWGGSIAATPWYGNKGNGTVQHDLHYACLIQAVQGLFNVSSSREDMLAISYSKGGWGGMSLMLRQKLFGFLACWDVPWTLQYTGTDFGQVQYFGSQAQYNLYNPQSIFDSYSPSVNDKTRIVLAGYNTFQADLTNMQAFLQARSIGFIFQNTSQATHNFDAGWAPSALSALFSLRGQYP